MMIQEILSGQFDGQLTDIANALRQRREYLAQLKLFDFKVGDSVKFGPNSQRFSGLTGKIVKKNRKRLVVQTDTGQVATPPGLLIKL
jgi:ribosomal protein L21E